MSYGIRPEHDIVCGAGGCRGRLVKPTPVASKKKEVALPIPITDKPRKPRGG